MPKNLTLESDPDDLRYKIVKLTKSGKALKLKAALIPETLGCLLNVTVQDLDAMKEVLQSIHESLLVREEK